MGSVVVLTERLLVELPGPSADAVSVNAELRHHTSIANKELSKGAILFPPPLPTVSLTRSPSDHQKCLSSHLRAAPVE